MAPALLGLLVLLSAAPRTAVFLAPVDAESVRDIRPADVERALAGRLRHRKGLALVTTPDGAALRLEVVRCARIAVEGVVTSVHERPLRQPNGPLHNGRDGEARGNEIDASVGLGQKTSVVIEARLSGGGIFLELHESSDRPHALRDAADDMARAVEEAARNWPKPTQP